MDETSETSEKGRMSDLGGPQNLTLNTHKAGMQGLDTERINDIIKRASEGSRFFQHKQKHQDHLNEKLQAMKREASNFTQHHINKATTQMDQLVQELEAERDLSRTIVHVDMDMFYAAVEMRDDPSLRDKPMAVGSTGMLSTSNYAARKYGVRAAMPGFIGRKLCPELIIVPPNFTKYKAVSQEVQEVFAQYDPGFSPMSLDEAYLDITDFINKHSAIYAADDDDDGDSHECVAQAVVKEMRHKIKDKTQLTASAGIAVNTRLAKVCSDLNKPDGQYYLPQDRDHILGFISSLPIRKVSGIGNVMEQHLQALDITQCGHLMDKRGLLKLLFSETNYIYFLNIALGLGHTTLSAWTERDRKSISTETTFKGTSDRQTLFSLSSNLCQELADDMQRKDILGKVLTLKLKTTDFQIKTRAQTLSEATRCPQVMAAGIKRLLLHEMNAATDEPLSLRLLGVRMSSLVSSSEVGQRRQATLTQMFSQPSQPKASSSSTLHHTEQELPQTHTQTQPVTINTQPNTTLNNTQAVTAEKPKHSEKKSPSIEDFLFKPKPAEEDIRMEVYECSVCEELVNVESLEEFNKHLDTCLEIHSSPPVPNHNTHTRTKQDFGPGEECKAVSGGEIQSDVMGKNESNPCYSTTDCSANQDLLCPVCEQRSFNNMTSLNMHIDECLNRNAISEILQESKQQDTRQRPDTAKNNAAKKRKVNAESNIQKRSKSELNTLDKYLRS